MICRLLESTTSIYHSKRTHSKSPRLLWPICHECNMRLPTLMLENLLATTLKQKSIKTGMVQRLWAIFSCVDQETEFWLQRIVMTTTKTVPTGMTGPNITNIYQTIKNQSNCSTAGSQNPTYLQPKFTKDGMVNHLLEVDHTKSTSIV